MTGPEPCRFREWDSRHWGLRIAQVEGSRLTPKSAASIRSWCESRAIDCVYFLADDDPETLRLAEGAGYRRVDTRVTLEREPEASPAGAEGIVRLFEPNDLPVLCRIARSSHHATRFYRDGRFPGPKCDDLYETWIRKSCGGEAQAVFVAAPDGPAKGYLTCHLDEPAEGKIGLMAVAEDARGKGLGRALVREALRWFGARSVRRVSVVTQGDEGGARRFYESCRFAVCSVQVWYHGWLREASA
jgi:dTDP-4-amino-4,6-dideoxy-D-galactose acyltransferase